MANSTGPLLNHVPHNAEIGEMIEKVLSEWEAAAVIKLNAAINKDKINLTGALLNSLRTTMKSASAAYKAALEFHFYEYGRYKDMKRVNYQGKMPPYQEVLDWVQRVGINKFKYVPGYPIGVMPLGNTKSKFAGSIAEQRIAFGFIRHVQKTGYYKRKSSRKGWYNKVLWGQLDDLIDALMEGMKTQTLHLIKNEFDMHSNLGGYKNTHK